jgi:hypothetical protein
MSDLHCIEQALQSTGWNQARIKFLARFLVALIAVKTVCLSQIACVFPGPAKPASHYKRIQRFLRHFDLDTAALAKLVVRLVGQEPPWTLALDRTNWKLGKSEINILLLALVWRGVAFPLFWTVLEKEGRGKAGNSNTQERIALVERFVSTFGANKIAWLCADREFVSKQWLAWLLRQHISFRLRLKCDTLVANGRGEMVCADWLFRDCPLGRERLLVGARRCLGQHLFVAGTRLCDDFLIVVSDTPVLGLRDYALRWGIETLFGCLKSRGFCLEATHVIAPERLSKLLALLTLAFCWAFAAGLWRAEQQPPPLKKHGRPAVSLFRSGLDWLRRVLMPLCGQAKQGDFRIALQFLSCT